MDKPLLQLSRLVTYKVHEIHVLESLESGLEQLNHIERLVEKESKYSEKVPGVKVSTPAQRAMLGYYELLESLFINQMNMAKSGILSQIKAHKIKTIMNPGI